MTKRTLIIAMGLMLVGLAISPAVAAKPPAEPPCRDRYLEIDLGPYEIVSRDSCSYSVEESDDGEGPGAAEPASADLPCEVDETGADCSELVDKIRPWITCPGPNPLCWNGGP